jgi:hypothetical protein
MKLSKIRKQALEVMPKQITLWSEQQINKYIIDTDIFDASETLKLPLEERRQHVIDSERINFILNESFSDYVIDDHFLKPERNKKIIQKVANAVESGRLNLDKGSRYWHGLYLDIQHLVWARNFDDGTLIDIRTEEYGGEEIGSLKVS